MAFLFSGLYEAIPDVDLYLERIDYHGDQRPTLDNLRELVRKNQTHIPYGNTILFEGYNGRKQMSMVSLALQPVEFVDLVPLNYYACMAEMSPVTQGIIVEMSRDNGSARIRKDQLTITSGDRVEKRIIETDEDLNAVLWEVFGIKEYFRQ